MPLSQDAANFSYAMTQYNLHGGTVTQIAKVDPTRYGLGFCAIGSTSFWVQPGKDLGSLTGIYVSGLPQPAWGLFMDYPRFRCLVNDQWFGYSNSSSNSIWTVEIFYRPQGDGANLGQLIMPGSL